MLRKFVRRYYQRKAKREAQKLFLAEFLKKCWFLEDDFSRLEFLNKLKINDDCFFEYLIPPDCQNYKIGLILTRDYLYSFKSGCPCSSLVQYPLNSYLGVAYEAGIWVVYSTYRIRFVGRQFDIIFSNYALENSTCDLFSMVAKYQDDLVQFLYKLEKQAFKSKRLTN